VRRLFLLCLLLSGAARPDAAFAKDKMGGQLTMPYACAVERGRLKLASSSPKTYRIVGRRAEQVMTVCRMQWRTGAVGSCRRRDRQARCGAFLD
jgi:hypothetical protein